MNKENLLRMAKHLKNVPRKLFSMEMFRYCDNSGDMIPECNSVGCIIGHCVILDEWEEVPKVFGVIDFLQWSEKFTGILSLSPEWHWCFSGKWSTVDNTVDGAIARIIWLLENGLPENWHKQMCGKQPLCYTDIKVEDHHG